jgi:glyoxylase-like metal-dependent hydrolase (beta-lactamase superfamily II)
MIVETLVVGVVQTNCYVIAEEDTGRVGILDPGGPVEQILCTVHEVGTRLETDPWVDYVVNTHAHFDHILGNGPLIEALAHVQPAPPMLVVHAQAVSLLSMGGGAELFGLRAEPSPEPDLVLGDGDELRLGGSTFQVLHTPGHSPGSISLYSAAERCVFVGDLLFAQGVGRTDLPGGDWSTLLRSIRTRLLVLPDETVVYPGHGPRTTIGRERRSNPFL